MIFVITKNLFVFDQTWRQLKVVK